MNVILVIPFRAIANMVRGLDVIERVGSALSEGHDVIDCPVQRIRIITITVDRVTAEMTRPIGQFENFQPRKGLRTFMLLSGTVAKILSCVLIRISCSPDSGIVTPA